MACARMASAEGDPGISSTVQATIHLRERFGSQDDYAGAARQRED